MQAISTSLVVGFLILFICVAFSVGLIYHSLKKGGSSLNQTSCWEQALRICGDCAFQGKQDQCPTDLLPEYCQEILNEKGQYLNCEKYLSK